MNQHRDEHHREPATATAFLAQVHAARRDRDRASAREFASVARFAETYRATAAADDLTEYVVPGTERRVEVGGDGTPLIAEFCITELSAALGMASEEGELLIRDALAVKYRFPRLWERTMNGLVPTWQAKQVSALTTICTAAACADIDAKLERVLPGMTWCRVEDLVRGMVLAARDETDVTDERERLRAHRAVHIHHHDHGLADISAFVDSSDAIFLDAQLNRLATIIGQGSAAARAEDGTDLTPHSVRRAQALGVLASPARALQLLQASLLDHAPELDLDPDCPARGHRGHTCGTVTVDPERLLPKTQMVVHLTDATARDGAGLARVEKVGPMLAGWLKDLLGDTRVNVRPVLAPDRLHPTDAYEVPERMREWVTLRSPTDVFPYGRKPSRGRRIDLDHTIAWQKHDALTRPDNLGPLSRCAHRAKTHGGWHLDQPHPGVFHWRSPLGFEYLVTPSISRMIHDPAGTMLAGSSGHDTGPPA